MPKGKKVKVIKLSTAVSETSDKIEDVNDRKCVALADIYSNNEVLGVLESKGDVLYVVK